MPSSVRADVRVWVTVVVSRAASKCMAKGERGEFVSQRTRSRRGTWSAFDALACIKYAIMARRRFVVLCSNARNESRRLSRRR